MVEVTIFGAVALCAAGVIGAVMFAPEKPLDEPYWAKDDDDEPLAIEAGPSTVNVEANHRWDEVDQHWGETQWMMQVGA